MEEALQHNIVQAAALDGHAADDLAIDAQIPVVGGAVLAALIRVDKQRLRPPKWASLGAPSPGSLELILVQTP